MERRDFIIKSGMMLTASTFLHSMAGCAENNRNTISLIKEKEDKYKKRPNPDSFSQPVMKAIAVGINAPSPHNTQSWKFKIINDESMFFYVDRSNLLPATDPPSRQIHIGAGCFIETLVIGITQFGYTADVSYFPEGYENSADFGIKPVAEIRIKKHDSKVDPLAAYILDRQTSRKPSTGNLVSQSTFEEVMAFSGKTNATIRFYNQNLSAFKSLFFNGLDVEFRTRSANEETRLLFRFSEEERALKRDGLSLPQSGFDGFLSPLIEKSLKNGDPNVWHSPNTIDKSLKSLKKSIDTTKGVVLWITESNTVSDWIENGRDYVRFSLAAIAKDLYLHPYNQTIQEYPEMDLLRADLDKLIGISGNQKIQFIARIGHSSKPYYSYRKSLDKYII
jgi:hypothetical protein